MSEMFCYQCEQTSQGTGCTVHGVCGKDPQTAALQDLLVHAAKGISQYAHRARQFGAKDYEVDVFVIEALFATVTNVNFDPHRLGELLARAADLRDRAKAIYQEAAEAAGGQLQQPAGPAEWKSNGELDDLVAQGRSANASRRIQGLGPDAAGLQELILYGLKGMAAYADHAQALDKEDDQVYAFFHEAMDFLASCPTDVDKLMAMVNRCGEVNLKVMGMLDAANTGTFGEPEPTEVRVSPVTGKCVLVSGHDLKDLAELLKQTEGAGINIYTHGEMLPCLAYPGLKKYKHLVGNFGGAWQDQRKEFDEFPGPILMTTNCLQKPTDAYKGRIFTRGLVGYPGVRHIPDWDFRPVIAAALMAPGFKQDAEKKTITIGFGHGAVINVADKVVEAVKAGKIRRFFLIGGCDGAKSGRNYYTELAQQVPDDCVILTLACGKYRFNKLDFGHIDGIPRLLDCGQCNDAYSAIRIAQMLARAFHCSVNNLPLSIVLSWFEQKAVCILLTLLYLGIRDMRIGPSLPAFVSPAILKVLAAKYNLMPIRSPQDDLATMLAD